MRARIATLLIVVMFGIFVAFVLPETPSDSLLGSHVPKTDPATSVKRSSSPIGGKPEANIVDVRKTGRRASDLDGKHQTFLRVWVVDESNEPIESVEVVVLRDELSIESSNLVSVGSTNSKGLFSVATNSEAVHVVVNRRRGSIPEYSEVHQGIKILPSVGERDLKISLAECTAVLRVRALNSSGHPVAGLHIGVVEELGRRVKGVTDSNGECSFERLPSGRVWVESTPTASTTPQVRATRSVPFIVASNQENVIDLTLIENGTVKVVAQMFGDLSEEDYHVQLTFFPLGPHANGPPVLVSVSRDKHMQTASLPAGEYQVSVNSAHPAFLTNDRIEVVENSECEVRAHVNLAGKGIRGRVLGPTGQGVGDVTVTAQYRNPLNEKEWRSLNAQTNSIGGFVLPAIPRNSVRLKAAVWLLPPGQRDGFSFFGSIDKPWQDVWTTSRDVVLQLEPGYSIDVTFDVRLKEGETLKIDRFRFASPQSFSPTNLSVFHIGSLRCGRYVLSRVDAAGRIVKSREIDFRQLSQGTFAMGVRL